ncbi:MAG: cation:proton antiporter, partial [Chloroflexi bacterium]|nr:cation:proton antiporter [Chloroflexota bacterium]
MLGVVTFGVVACACVMLASLLEQRTGLPSAALLVLIGLAYGALPGPNVTLEPDLVLVVVIPLLLYSAALNASLTQIRANLRAVVSLSVFLVLATTLAVGFSVAAVLPGLGLAPALALGAAIAPPDPVAALAVARRTGLPDRLVALIEGEGLLNDAAALTLYEVAVAAALGAGDFAPAMVAGRFVFDAIGGIAVGVAVAWLIQIVRNRLEEALVENALSLVTPFVAYVPAAEAHVSGVLSVVIAGLWLGHSSPVLLSGASRLQTRAVWRVIDFLLEGFVFLLIGDQLPVVLSVPEHYTAPTTILAVLASLAAVLLTRPVWLVLSFPLLDRLGLGRRDRPVVSARDVLALSWAGTRGVISLAAMFALPEAFPYRDLLLLCAYVVVLVTLVGQGLTFAPFVRTLGIRADRGSEVRGWSAAREAAIDAGVRHLDTATADRPELAQMAEVLRRAADRRRELSGE